MKKIVALALAALLTLTSMACLSVVFAEGTAPAASDATYVYDFNPYVKDTYKTFGLNNRKNIAGMKEAKNGYLNIRMDKNKTASNPYPHLTIDVLPTNEVADLGVVLIKYQFACAGNRVGKWDVTLSNGDTKTAEWTYNCNGKWNFALIDATELWGNAGAGVTMTGLHFFTMEGAARGDELHIQYIKFFSNVEAAEAAQASDGAYVSYAGELTADQVFYDATNERYFSASPLAQLSDEPVGSLYRFGSNTIFVQVGTDVYAPSEGVLVLKEGVSIEQKDDGSYVLLNGVKETAVTRVTDVYSGVDGNLYTEGNGELGNSDIMQYAGVYNLTMTAADVVVPAVTEAYEAAAVTGADVKTYSAYGVREDNVIFEVSEGLTHVVANGAISMDATIEAFGFAIDDQEPIFDDMFMTAADRCNIAASVDLLADGVHTVRFLVKANGATYEIPGTRTVVVIGAAVEKELAGYRVYATDYTFWYDEASARYFVRGFEFDVEVELDGTEIKSARYDLSGYVGKTPSAPLAEDATVVPAAMLDGAALSGVALPNDMNVGSYNRDGGYATFTATGANPYYTVLNSDLEVNRFLAICYRTGVAGSYGEIYAGSIGNEAMGVVDGGRVDYVADGEWHVAVVELPLLSGAYNENTNTISYLRHDVLAMDEAGAGVEAGASIDVAYYGFFATEKEALAYERAAESLPEVYLVSFLNEDGSVYTSVAYAPGATSVVEPLVPAKDGFDGQWADYTLADADITVSPIYTELETTPPATEESSTAEEESTTLVEEESTTVLDEEQTTAAAEETTAPVTEEPEAAGCKAVVASASVMAVVAAMAGAVALRKKEND